MMSIRLVWLLPFLFYSLNACADWNMSLAYKPIDAREGNFYAKITGWDTQDDRPNPLCGCQRSDDYCSLYFGYNGSAFDIGIYFPEIRTSKTLGELGKYFISRGFLNREYASRRYPPQAPVCFSFGYKHTTDISGSVGYWRLPGGEQCVPAVVTPNVCDLREQRVELDHGKLRPEVVNGSTASAQLTVACSFALNVRIMSSDRSGVIYFNERKQFRSDLKINGVDLGSGLVVQATSAGAALTLTSTLSGYDGSVGEFQGNKVIIVSLP